MGKLRVAGRIPCMHIRQQGAINPSHRVRTGPSHGIPVSVWSMEPGPGGIDMTRATVAAVQAAYVLMDREATLDKTEVLLKEAAANGADIVAFPEVFIPGTPLWIDAGPIWEGDEAWYAMLVDQAVVVPGPVTERLGQAAREAGCHVVIGVNERDPHGATIYNAVLYFGSDGSLLGKHRKLVPTGSERTVWGMGDGSTLDTFSTPIGRIGGLTCWENYMPLARFFLYSQGVDIWFAPTLARGDGWIATMRHIAREGRCYVAGVSPCLHEDQIPPDFPNRDKVWLREEGDDAVQTPRVADQPLDLSAYRDRLGRGSDVCG
jgi:nitrilase